jgi:hypothetical protein
VPVERVQAAARAQCVAFVAALPDEVDPGVRRRPVTGDAGLTAAWGDPPVTLACGVPAPDRPEDQVVVNDVSWSVRDIGAGFRWTSDTAVRVAVEIPDAYANGVEIVNPISEALAPLASPAPSPA